jgi:hypothetical protein
MHCAYCDKPLRPQIVRTVEVPVGEVYAGPLTVVSQRSGSKPGFVRLGLWDGKSYGRPHQRGDSVFCAATCAGRFAEAAHRSGFRMPSRGPGALPAPALASDAAAARLRHAHGQANGIAASAAEDCRPRAAAPLQANGGLEGKAAAL